MTLILSKFLNLGFRRLVRFTFWSFEWARAIYSFATFLRFIPFWLWSVGVVVNGLLRLEITLFLHGCHWRIDLNFRFDILLVDKSIIVHICWIKCVHCAAELFIDLSFALCADSFSRWWAIWGNGFLSFLVFCVLLLHTYVWIIVILAASFANGTPDYECNHDKYQNGNANYDDYHCGVAWMNDTCNYVVFLKAHVINCIRSCFTFCLK